MRKRAFERALAGPGEVFFFVSSGFLLRAGLRAGLLLGRDGARPSIFAKVTIDEVVENLTALSRQV